MSNEIIIQRVSQLIESSQMQQKQFAESVHIKPQTFNGYITGYRPFPLEVIIAVADHFNVSIDYLLGRTDDPEIKTR